MEQKSGIFLVNKPRGMTTNQLIQKIKHHLGVEKIGHAGTLDPLATGLVIVLVNQATKLSNLLLTEQKNYTATLKLFSATNTGDQEGEITNTETPRVIEPRQLELLTKKFNSYIYDQHPPLFSAIKIGGKKLYQYARKQESIVPPPRSVTIHQFQIDAYDRVQHTLKFTTTVSKGTYIRSLGEDLAQNLGTIGHLVELTRNQSGNFKLNQAKNWESLTWDDLISIYDVLTLANYPIVILKNALLLVRHGQPLSLPPTTPDAVFIADEQQQIVAYYRRRENGLYYCLRGGFIN